MSLWLTLLYYMMVASAAILILLLLIAGHWLGIFLTSLCAAAFALGVVIGLGEARNQDWAKRLSRLLFMR